LAGKLLVATPKLAGTPFEQAVVLVMQHNQQGTFGVTLNRPADDSAVNAWQKLIGADADIDRNVVNGGPMNGPVFAIHESRSLSEMEMPGGIFVSAQVDKLRQLSSQFEHAYRIVLGVAGWQVGQLARELGDGYWYVMPADAEQIFDDPQWMWQRCIEQYGRTLLQDVVGIDGFPDDPSLN
jgi:putative transcriptional regulator